MDTSIIGREAAQQSLRAERNCVRIVDGDTIMFVAECATADVFADLRRRHGHNGLFCVKERDPLFVTVERVVDGEVVERFDGWRCDYREMTDAFDPPVI